MSGPLTRSPAHPLLFGRYVGTVTEARWWWVNPFAVFWRKRRGNADEVRDSLQTELQTRLHTAGIEVLETRLSP